MNFPLSKQENVKRKLGALSAIALEYTYSFSAEG